MSVGYYQNQYYSLPLNLYTTALIFNRELLERAGYSEPPGTMEEVLELARKHRYTIGLGGLEAWDTLPYVYSLGGAFMNEDFSKASGYLNGKETIRAVEQLASLYRNNQIDISVLIDNVDHWAGVRSEELFMTDEAPWFYGLLNHADLDRALKQTLPVPFPKSNGPASIIGGENLVIMKGSKRRDEAWAFMKWMTRREAQLVMSRAGLIPTNREAVEALTG